MTAETSGLDSLLADPSFREELMTRLSNAVRGSLEELLATGQIVLTLVDLRAALGLSGAALQIRLRHLLAAALVGEGNADLQTAALVAGVAPEELLNLLERYGFDFKELPRDYESAC